MSDPNPACRVVPPRTDVKVKVLKSGIISFTPSSHFFLKQFLIRPGKINFGNPLNLKISYTIMSIKIEGLTKLYGQQKAVDHITFDIKKGEIAGFIGPNGSGKSTTMKCICGVLPPNEGHIEVSGKDVQKDVLGVKKIIGYLPENNPLYYEMYIREYLTHVAGYYHSGRSGKKAVDRTFDWIG